MIPISRGRQYLTSGEILITNPRKVHFEPFPSVGFSTISAFHMGCGSLNLTFIRWIRMPTSGVCTMKWMKLSTRFCPMMIVSELIVPSTPSTTNNRWISLKIQTGSPRPGLIVKRIARDKELMNVLAQK